ncbi:hypothetical protein AADZ90_021205 [Aestuariibius sp. 2305UL40-4]|uniref:hypothetical protein n=1 Tax=Aestuariibius violaceus TaxID=3234132 RepID=UPI00345E47AE
MQWPKELWAAENPDNAPRGEHVFSEFATVPQWEGDEREYHRYVDADVHESAERYFKHQVRGIRDALNEIADGSSFQSRVDPWMQACFGPEISADIVERNHRFLEEALELVQAKGCTASEAHQLVDYVFGREIGDPHQEVGGVMVTLAALCTSADLNMDRAAEDELQRVWTKVDAIRAKQAAKPKHSPLPE